MDVIKLIEKERKKHKIKRKEVAEAANLTISQYNNLIVGRTELNFCTAVKLLKAFELDLQIVRIFS